MIRTIALAIALVAASAVAASADVVYLADGKKYEGEVTDLGEKVRVVTKMGALLLPKGQVTRIERGQPAPEVERVDAAPEAKTAPPPAPAVPVDPASREEYRKRAVELDELQFSARLGLASWCIERGMLEEAQVQLRYAALMAPKNDELITAWTSLAARLPRRRIIVILTLDDGNVIRGACSPMPFIIRHATGVRLVPIDQLRGLSLVKLGKVPVVAVDVPDGRIEGELLAPPLVVKSSIGEFSVPMERIRKFAIEGQTAPDAPPADAQPPATPAAPAPAPAAPPAAGEVELNWDRHLARLKTHGLEIMFVFDSTGSMGGIILETKTRIRQLMRVVTTLVPNTRVGFVTYRDQKKYDLDDYQFTVKFVPLQTGDQPGLDKLSRFLRETEAYGGGDIPEAVLDGVQTAVERGGWNANAAKVIIVFGDAPPRPETQARLYDLCKQWKASGNSLSCIDTTGGSKLMTEFQRMAADGGGEATFLNDERAIVKQLVVYAFGSKYAREIDRTYNEVLKGPPD